MPTENRSSNTSELLPCPFCGQHDFLIERLDSDASVVICQGLTGPHEACLARGPVGVAQNEGEEQPGRDKAVELWNARAEQRQGEPIGEVVAFGKGLHEIAWSQGKMPRLGAKLYTHADPGEVERLRAELESERGLRRKLAARLSQYKDEAKAEADTLRAQLAEQNALLRDAALHASWMEPNSAAVLKRINAALSASAEPKS
ncbi:Lar family restriction alleviation protein [Pseudomonas sp. RIT623]|uniref:Lar family restriction alleviation protein n=1 Tax=Pseudomonas sp. RIT623 TaxID=2559075 RepID=UPI001070180D|nr:Lar family restriction alleviation protein [Pseudomonas sp. RIT623]TFF34909.1 hypothetical protein E3U47_22530 [Pseudomonas sp. RIT623]